LHDYRFRLSGDKINVQVVSRRLFLWLSRWKVPSLDYLRKEFAVFVEYSIAIRIGSLREARDSHRSRSRGVSSRKRFSRSTPGCYLRQLMRNNAMHMVILWAIVVDQSASHENQPSPAACSISRASGFDVGYRRNLPVRPMAFTSRLLTLTVGA